MLIIPPFFSVDGANLSGKYAHTLPAGISIVAIAEKQIVISRPYAKQSTCRIVTDSSCDAFRTVNCSYRIKFVFKICRNQSIKDRKVLFLF
nr:MAG TPA: hypothetical protein [Caudoviricetes sp.]